MLGEEGQLVVCYGHSIYASFSPFLPQSLETPGLVGSFSALLELFLVFFFVNKPQVGSIDSRTLGGEAVTGKCGEYCVHACFI